MLSIKVKKPKPVAYRLAFATLSHAMHEQLAVNTRVVRLADDVHGTVREVAAETVTVAWDDGETGQVRATRLSQELRIVNEPVPAPRTTATPARKAPVRKPVDAEAAVAELAANVDKLVEAAVKAEIIDEDDATIRTVELEAADENERRQLASRVLAAQRRTAVEEQPETPAAPQSACDLALAKLHETKGKGNVMTIADLGDDIGDGPRDLSMIAGDRDVDLYQAPFDLDKGLGDETMNILAQQLGHDVSSDVGMTRTASDQLTAQLRRKPTVVGTSMEGITGPRTPLVIEDTSAYPPTLKDMLANLDWSGTPKQGAGQ